MPQPRSSSRTPLTRLVFFLFLGWALLTLGKRTDDVTASEHAAPVERAEPAPGKTATRARRRTRRQRLATSLAFATLFFSGAALSAGAGDMLVEAIETTPTATTETIDTTEKAEDAAAAEEPPADDAAADGTATDAPAEETPAGEAEADDASTDEPPAEETPAEPGTPADSGGTDGGDGTEATGGTGGAQGSDESGPGQPNDGGSGPAAPPAPAGPPVVKPHDHAEDAATRRLDPEAGALGSATVWLHRSLPDPTPPARRLAPDFARALRAQASAAGIGWSTVLAALRADGELGRRPATTSELRTLARTLARLDGQGEWQAFLALRGRTAFADRAQAFARYNRAVGLNALITGLDAAKKGLTRGLLADSRVSIYAGGRSDLAAGRIDVRVVVLLRYLAQAHGQVTVSSLHSGHRYYSRPGVVSAHTYGLAVDIAALGGRAILGNSQPGGTTEHAVRNVLLLPAELRPQQVISLLGLGGPSFPLANHADHIHVGY